MRMYRIVVTKCNELQGKADDSDLKWYKISRMGEVWFSEEVEKEREGRQKSKFVGHCLFSFLNSQLITNYYNWLTVKFSSLNLSLSL